MRKLFYISLVSISVLFAFSCKKTSVDSNAAPVISFASFTTTDQFNAVLTFNFSDANGNNNIGLHQGDTAADFYMRFYYKNYKGNFVPYYFPISGQPQHSPIDSSITTYGIPFISTNSNVQSISGQVIIHFTTGYRPFIPNTPPINIVDSLQHFRYEFYIYDRNMRKSNVVTTPEFDTNY
ncbi:MAG TPA: hypothetical protein VF411_02685 [Bacteroidia bacterium]